MKTKYNFDQGKCEIQELQLMDTFLASLRYVVKIRKKGIVEILLGKSQRESGAELPP